MLSLTYAVNLDSPQKAKNSGIALGCTVYEKAEALPSTNVMRVRKHYRRRDRQ